MKYLMIKIRIVFGLQYSLVINKIFWNLQKQKMKITEDVTSEK